MLLEFKGPLYTSAALSISFFFRFRIIGKSATDDFVISQSIHNWFLISMVSSFSFVQFLQCNVSRNDFVIFESKWLKLFNLKYNTFFFVLPLKWTIFTGICFNCTFYAITYLLEGRWNISFAFQKNVIINQSFWFTNIF